MSTTTHINLPVSKTIYSIYPEQLYTNASGIAYSVTSIAFSTPPATTEQVGCGRSVGTSYMALRLDASYVPIFLS
ncbi:hypothetical protein M378DRAFT_163207, partial [Amanita muscaria Koide BX008]